MSFRQRDLSISGYRVFDQPSAFSTKRMFASIGLLRDANGVTILIVIDLFSQSGQVASELAEWSDTFSEFVSRTPTILAFPGDALAIFNAM